MYNYIQSVIVVSLAPGSCFSIRFYFSLLTPYVYLNCKCYVPSYTLACDVCAQIDAIGTKRRDDEGSGDREVQRTMLELLNQLDGFSSDNKIKVIAATNRPDTLDPALLR